MSMTPSYHKKIIQANADVALTARRWVLCGDTCAYTCVYVCILFTSKIKMQRHLKKYILLASVQLGIFIEKIKVHFVENWVHARVCLLFVWSQCTYVSIARFSWMYLYTRIDKSIHFNIEESKNTIQTYIYYTKCLSSPDTMLFHTFFYILLSIRVYNIHNTPNQFTVMKWFNSFFFLKNLSISH